MSIFCCISILFVVVVAVAVEIFFSFAHTHPHQHLSAVASGDTSTATIFHLLGIIGEPDYLYTLEALQCICVAFLLLAVVVPFYISSNDDAIRVYQRRNL